MLNLFTRAWLGPRKSPGKKLELEDMLTSFPEALEELKNRQENQALRKAVESYLRKDIPPVFQSGPVLYLARHVVTPNFETLRFLHLVEAAGYPVAIGQDPKDKFVSLNSIKHALGKLSFLKSLKRTDAGYDEQYEHHSVVDFNTNDGKSFDSIQTHWGEGIVDFHNDLLRKASTIPVIISDDSAWIDRHHRGNLLEHYKKFLALFLLHGILFEDYLPHDPGEAKFIEDVLKPAFIFIESKFGFRPLITHLNPTGVESSRFWIAYPASVRKLIDEKIAGNPQHAR